MAESIEDTVEENEHMTLLEIAAKIREKNNLKVSASLIQDRLSELRFELKMEPKRINDCHYFSKGDAYRLSIEYFNRKWHKYRDE